MLEGLAWFLFRPRLLVLEATLAAVALAAVLGGGAASHSRLQRSP
jgi:hypothetical protein